jgi:putative transposase
VRPAAERRKMVERKPTAKLSVSRQCGLLGLHRSGLYYRPVGESKLNLQLMRLMDEHYLLHPEKGAIRMHTWLTKDKGFQVNQKRVERLYYDVMGLRAILPGPHTSKRHKDHKVFPYLLRDLEITKCNQVWATDITYIPLEKGFMYLCAIIDLNSRYVVNWSLSNSMEAEWCKQVYEEAVAMHGNPDILNTDQGSQFTAEDFTAAVLGSGARLSMDGKGRATDNAFIERLWRSVKYEKLYPNPVNDGMDLYGQLEDYFDYYNHERRHSTIHDEIPAERYGRALKMKAA